MAETQMSMFGGDSEQLHALIDRLDDIPDDVLKKNWPRTLSELVEVTGAELQRQGIEPVLAGKLARKVAAAQAAYMGGRGYYLPVGESLFAELRNNEIFSRWDLPPFLHRYADSENIMRQRNNAKTPRTTA